MAPQEDSLGKDASLKKDVTEPFIDIDDPPFPLTATDRQLLTMRDEDFHLYTWEDLKRIIANNTLDDLKRRPSDLKRYIQWSADIKAQHGSMTNFVLTERLQWPSSLPQTALSQQPLINPSTYTILKNDWPYGVSPGIDHLVVWTQIPIPADSARDGDVTAASRGLISAFVERVFARRLTNGSEDVLWFKNWSALQSVRGVDHVHVLVRGASSEVLDFWTGGAKGQIGLNEG